MLLDFLNSKSVLSLNLKFELQLLSILTFNLKIELQLIFLKLSYNYIEFKLKIWVTIISATKTP